MAAAGYLIWVPGVGGRPEPQRVEHLPQPTGSDYWKGRVIDKHELDDVEFRQSLDWLARRYPCRPKAQEG